MGVHKTAAARLELFAQAIAKGKSFVEAATEAGYPHGSSFADNARKRSHRPDVKARVAELQAHAAERTNLTMEKLIGYAQDVRERAMELDDLSAANTAWISMGKLVGLWRERTDLNVTNEGLADRIAEVWSRIATRPDSEDVPERPA